jgi:hypothetical protein
MSPTPEQHMRRLYEEAEACTAQAVEEIVGRESFDELLAKVTNVAALTRIGNDTWDLVVRNLRLAGRPDITRLGRQLARTEDKLELVLQELEAVRDEVAALRGENGKPAAKTRSASRKSGSSRTS